MQESEFPYHSDFDRKNGTIIIIFQEMGNTPVQLSKMNAGESLLDFVGPLGNPSKIEPVGTVVCVGGGVDVAPIYPIVRAHRQVGNKVISIIGSRSADLLLWEEKMWDVSDELYITTDDGTMVL